MSILNTSVFAREKHSKVVVIGAGIAGLTAAYRLYKEGMDVDLYEARNRVGGRILSVNVNGQIAELGAQNITDGGEAVHINHLINEFGLELTSSRINLSHCYFDGKNLIPISQLLKNKKFDPYILKNQLAELASHSHNMKEVLEKILDENDPLYKVVAARLAAYEGASIEKLSSVYVETLFHMLLGGICAVHQGNGETESYVDLVSIQGGNALLPQKIAATLDTKLHLQMPLSKVGKQRDGSFKLTFANGQEIECDILVLAIPCSVYEQIVFEDDVIPRETLDDIQSIRYGETAKIMVPFSSVPLEKSGLVSDQILSFFDVSQKMLTVFYIGKASLFSNDTIRSSYLEARPMIEMEFSDGCSFLKDPIFVKDENAVMYDAPVGYSWPNDPYVKGSYSYISPGQETLLTTLTEEKGEKFKTLFAPIENLYFAGEHASILLDIPGTMEAACESGERVAHAILKKQ